MFSLSGKCKNQIPCFPCAVATLGLVAVRKLPLVRTETQPRNSTANCTNRHVYGVWCVYGVCMRVYVCLVWSAYLCACMRVCVWCMRVLTVLAVLGPGPPAVVVRFPSDLRGRARLVAHPAWTWKNARMLGSFYCASNKVIRQGASAVRQIKSYVRELRLCAKGKRVLFLF